MRVRIVLFTLLVTLLLSLVSVQALAVNPTFNDIDGHWAQQMIQEFASRGYLKGYADGSFRPDAPIIRAEAGAFVSRLGFPVTAEAIAYSDLEPGTWFYEEIMRATHTGFINGYPDNTFRPYANILREEAFKLASLFWGDVDMEEFFVRFTDSSQVGPWARQHMEKLVRLSVIEGYPDNTIRPKSEITRAEFVKLFYKILIAPVYTNVSVRAVNIHNPDYDIVEPQVYLMEIGDEAVFDAPKTPSNWILQGDVVQTHTVTDMLEVVFLYQYTSSGGGSQSTPTATPTPTITPTPTVTPTPTYELRLEADGAGNNDVIFTGAGLQTVGEAIYVKVEYDADLYVFQGWYNELSVQESVYEGFKYTMPANDVTLTARFDPR